MNWRRGLLLAGIHLAVAAPLIVMLEARHEAFMREHYVPPAPVKDESASKATLSGEEEQTVNFNPCDMTVDYSPEQEFPTLINIPAATLAQWEQVCPAKWSLAGMLKVGYDWFPKPSAIPARRKVDCGFGLLIAVQWFLVGSLPLIRPKRWWLEPGAFIACCAVIGLLILPLARLPALLAVLAWFWWFGLLLWQAARFGWNLVARKRPAPS